MKVLAKLSDDGSDGKLFAGGQVFNITNRVKRLKDGSRKSSEVVRSMPDDLPYDPHLFPAGTWRITAVEWQKQKGFDPKSFGPVKIRTNAWQPVRVWELDSDGDYFKETAREVKDTGYLLHASSFSTTWGCIRLNSQSDAVTLGGIFSAVLEKGEEITLEVSFG
jgi:hypothetical protein